MPETQLEKRLRDESFNYIEASEITGVDRFVIMDWIRRGVMRVDRQFRPNRPMLSVNDLFRIYAGGRLTAIGLGPKTIFSTALGTMNVFEAASAKHAGLVYWIDSDGLPTETVYYSDGETLKKIAEKHPAIVIPTRTLARELIDRVIAFLAQAEEAAAKDGSA